MCIIAYAPKGVTISDKRIINMYQNNDDGAGIMWKPNDGSPIRIQKGFFNEKDLLKAWHSIPIDCEKAVHCRIATHGRVNVSCCHPFPVRDTTYAMKSKKDSCGLAFMHNGIISLTSPPKGIKSAFSDSMMFGKEILYPLINCLDSIYIQQMIECSIGGSKLLIFRQNGDTIRLGFWECSDKCFFSNNSYTSSYYSYFKSNTKTKSVKATKEIVAPKSNTSVYTLNMYGDWTNACNSCTTFDCANCDIADGYYSGYSSDLEGEDYLLDDETRTLEEQYEEIKLAKEEEAKETAKEEKECVKNA